MEISEKAKQNILYFFVLALVIGGMLYYSNYRYENIQADYNAKLLQADKQLQTTKGELEEGIKIVDSSVEAVNNDLNSYKAANKQNIDNLNSLIRQIEEQSNLKLQELKGDIKDIQIQSADFSAIVEDVLQSTVSVVTNRGLGSGVVIREDGFIITNHHVIEGASNIKVDTYDGQRYSAAVAGINPSYDIAVLKVDKDIPALEFGDSDEAKVGSKVIALGNPAGLQFTVTEGIISAAREFNGIKYLQHDVSINPGNSGGPLVSQKGEIVGINNFKVGGLESLGFAIASNEVDSVANTLIEGYNAQNQ